MKSLLLFLAGALVGANIIYFMLRQEASAPAADPSTPIQTPVATSPPVRKTLAMPQPTAPAPVESSNAAPPAVQAPPASSPVDAAIPPTDQLLLPVQGIMPRQLVDSFNDPRGNGGRHEAIDIMAPRGTPVFAAIDGTVAKLFTSVRGGLTIYEFDPSRTYAYYYAHLDHYAPTLAQGQALKRGDVIGYVGSSGDASPDAPHLHFAIFALGPEKQWWKGTPVNPYPLLTATH
jgi:murein DD-endopeptidase MepM/ murein hydrolase activator NlpD